MSETVAQRLLANAEGDDGAEFLRLIHPGSDDEVLSYGELIESARRWTAAYAARGLRPGQRVIVILRHSRALYESYLGALLGGHVPAMFAFPSPKFSETEYFRTIGTLLRGARARQLVTYPELAALLRDREREALGDAGVFTPDDVAGTEPAATVSSTVDPESTAFLQYSSGTTGVKKGVAVSHRALLWQVETYADAIGASPSDRIVSWLPLYHDMGLIACFFLPLLRRVPLVAMSPFDWVRRPAMWLEAVSEHRATLSWLPNFAYNFIAANAGDADVRLDSLRGVVNCSEPILPASHDAFVERFAGNGFSHDRLAVSYALAENTFAATSGGFGMPPCEAEHDGRRVVSSGVPLPETDVLIVGDDGAPLPERTTGEVVLRSPSLLNEYDGNEEATRRALRDGRYWTGDLGFLADGHLFVTGRKQDLVIVGGKNIYPQDVEAVVGNVPGILPGRVVAFGVEREDLGTEMLVVLAETEHASSDLRRAVHAAVAEHADLTPGDVALLPPRTLVKSTAGKLSRGENRRRYLEEWTRAPSASRDGDVVRAAVLALLPADVEPGSVGDDSPLFTSGLLDSFATAELLAAVESAAGATIAAEALRNGFDTIAELRQALIEGGARPATRESLMQATAPTPYDDPERAWPPPPRAHALWTLVTRFALRRRGVAVAPGFRAHGPVTIELLGSPKNLRIGRNVTLMPGVHLKLRENGVLILGDGTKLDTAARLVVANDATLELAERVTLGAGTIVNAGADVRIGAATLSAGYCVINASDHGMAAGMPIREQGFEHAPISIGRDVWLGAHVFVAKGAVVGDGAVVSASAVVSGAVPPGAVVQGRPARVIGYRT